jgi:hypothetical protein
MKESTRVLLALIAATLLGVLIAASQNASLIRAADAIAIPLVVCHALNFPTLMKGPRLVGAVTSQ